MTSQTNDDTQTAVPPGSPACTSTTQTSSGALNCISVSQTAHDVTVYPKNELLQLREPTKVVRVACSPLSSLSSLERRACRICQSETGTMVRPCGCAGTMGDIHETCLSRWVVQSQRRDRCEICHEEYARSGAVLRPLRRWTRPKLDASDLLAVLTVAGLSFSIYYLITLMSERMFIERVFIDGLPIRSDDYARIFLTILLALLSLGMVSVFGSQFLAYVHRQREIRFVNRPPPTLFPVCSNNVIA